MTPCVWAGIGSVHAAFFGAALRWRRKRPSSRRLPLRGMRSMSLTSLAPPLRRSDLAAVKGLEFVRARQEAQGIQRAENAPPPRRLADHVCGWRYAVTRARRFRRSL